MTEGGTAPRASTSMLSSLRRLWPHAREFAPRVALGISAAAAASVVALLIPRVLEAFVNGPMSSGDADAGVLWLGVALVAALGLLEPALLVARRRLVLAPGLRLEANLRLMLYRHLVDLPPAFHEQWSGGQLLSRSVSDIRRFRRWLSFGLVMMVVNTITITVGVVFLIATSPLLGGIYLVVAVPAFLASLRSRRTYRGLSRRSQDQAGDLSTTIEESVHGIRILKSFGRENRALDDFTAQAEQLMHTELGKARSRAFVSFIMTLLPETALAVILVIGVLLVGNGALTVGGLLAFFATAALIAGPLDRLSEQFAMSLDARTAIDRYLEVLGLPNPMPDPEPPVAIPDGAGEVVFDGVAFAYSDAPTTPVLRDVSLTLRAGETIALVGLTGSGKSTLAQLVPRFYDVSAGRILVDGVDVRDLARADLRTLVSIAFEEPVLFSGSVRENVCVGDPDATEHELRAALETAEARFAYALPDGLDTRIGEEGLSLSGGQRQRLSLARAILANPRVLVLDDPLSALDVGTEAAVSTRLRAHLSRTTTLVIAHRASTVALADRVALLSDGRIAAIGTHSELLRTSPQYRHVILAESAQGRGDVARDDSERDDSERNAVSNWSAA